MTRDSELKGRACLVTGAAGCIGAWVVKQLRDAGAIPVVFDVTENRDRLHLIMEGADTVIWECGDITDFDRLTEIAERHNIEAIIHLAALQVPFCKANPIGSTQINVMGSIHILELARQQGITRLSYASSVAAPAMGDNNWLETLYGAHKICGEQMAKVYWQDWSVPSIGIRPAIIYGPGRDQGMSAAPTIALLAAEVEAPYTIPFSGDVGFVYVEDAAQRFIAAASCPHEGAHVFDLNGTPAGITTMLAMLAEHYPHAKVDYEGEAMPFPAEPNSGDLERFLGLGDCLPLSQGILKTQACFRNAQARGIDLKALFNQTVSKTP
jgi:nucleoside-diphosphate-sugar epimerase